MGLFAAPIIIPTSHSDSDTEMPLWFVIVAAVVATVSLIVLFAVKVPSLDDANNDREDRVIAVVMKTAVALTLGLLWPLVPFGVGCWWASKRLRSWLDGAPATEADEVKR